MRRVGYFGSKATSGLCQPIIAMMPPHDTYIETHLGGGALMRRKPAALRNIGIDRDARALDGFECDYPVELTHGCAQETAPENDRRGSKNSARPKGMAAGLPETRLLGSGREAGGHGPWRRIRRFSSAVKSSAGASLRHRFGGQLLPARRAADIQNQLPAPRHVEQQAFGRFGQAVQGHRGPVVHAVPVVRHPAAHPDPADRRPAQMEADGKMRTDRDGGGFRSPPCRP